MIAGVITLGCVVVLLIAAAIFLYYPLCMDKCKSYMRSDMGTAIFLAIALIILFLTWYLIKSAGRSFGALVQGGRGRG